MIKVWFQIVVLFAPFLHQSVTFSGFHCFHFHCLLFLVISFQTPPYDNVEKGFLNLILFMKTICPAHEPYCPVSLV